MSDTLGLIICLVCGLIVSAWGAWKLGKDNNKK